MTSNPERRRYKRIIAFLPLRLIAVAGKIEPALVPLVTLNISKAGVCFPVPRRIDPGEFIEIEVTLLGLGLVREDVHISSVGRVVRIEAGKKHGWYKLAAAFGEPPPGDEPGWHKLLGAFDERSSSATNS